MFVVVPDPLVNLWIPLFKVPCGGWGGSAGGGCGSKIGLLVVPLWIPFSVLLGEGVQPEVTKENKIATAGVLGGVAGLLLGGFWAQLPRSRDAGGWAWVCQGMRNGSDPEIGKTIQVVGVRLCVFLLRGPVSFEGTPKDPPQKK